MNYKRKLMAALIGLALLAAPITAAAKDRDSGRNDAHQARTESRGDGSASHSYSAPARANDRARNFVPAPMTHSESRDHHETRNAPVAVEHRDWNQGRDERGDRGRDYRDYRDHDRGDRDDYAVGAPYYVMPPEYAGGACAWAQHLRNVIARDRYTGHPAAASDLLPQLYRAEQACGGVPYGYNSDSYPW
jgi:hypothetical protein